MYESKLPINLKFLFENKYIECIQILIILFALKRYRKGIEIEELLYYFTILSMTTTDSNNQYSIDETYIQNNYLTFEKVVRDNVIILSNQNYIKVKVEDSKKKDNMYIKISDNEKSVIETLESRYLQMEKEKFQYILNNREFSSTNMRKVLGVNEN